MPNPVPEIRRICALPVEDPTPDLMRLMADKWTLTLMRQDRIAQFDLCEIPLRPIQGYALEAIQAYKGALIPMGVGAGKTLTALLAHKALGIPAKKCLILTFARLRDQMISQMAEYQEWYDFEPPVILSYEMLSQPKNKEYLRNLRPRLIVADEAHALKDSKANRTKRFLNYLRDMRRRGDEVAFVAMSGTLTTKSLHDYSHLALQALGGLTTVPASWVTLSEWANVLDVSPRDTASARAWNELRTLRAWCRANDLAVEEEFAALDDQTAARRAFGLRLRTAPGVCMTEVSSFSGDLTLSYDRTLTAPSIMESAIEMIQTAWILPNGDELNDPLRLAAAVSQASQGFYYKAVWPKGEPDLEWLRCRSGYNGILRNHAARETQGIDSIALLARAIEDEPTRILSVEEIEVVDAWKRVSHREPPAKETVWYCDDVIDHVVALVDSGWVGLIWYEWRAVGERLRERGLDVVLGGEKYDPLADPMAGKRALCLSVAAHGTGLHLAAWSRNYVLCPRTNGASWEQLIGRTARSGQRSSVEFTVLAHVPRAEEALRRAVEDATYIATTQATTQYLLTARSV